MAFLAKMQMTRTEETGRYDGYSLSYSDHNSLFVTSILYLLRKLAISLSTIVLAVFVFANADCGNAEMSTDKESRYTPDVMISDRSDDGKYKFTLMYDENNDLCKKIEKIYNTISVKEKNKWEHWERDYYKLFKNYGLEEPSRLVDGQYIGTPNPNGEYGVFYRLSLGAGVEQVVNMADVPIMGDIESTNIFILFPGKDILSWRESQDAISLSIEFAVGTEDNAKNKIAIPYYFNKGNVNARFMSEHYKVNKKLSPKFGLLGGGVVQRIYVYGNDVIFIARGSDDILVYTVYNGWLVDDK